MRKLSRHALALAVTAVLLGGCSAGGGAPDGGRRTPTAHTSQSGSAAPSRGTPRKAAPARPWNVHPGTIAAIGDSITRGFDACHPLSDCPDVSWATGGRQRVDSLSVRLSASGSWNLAQSGAHVADLPAQARAAAAHHPSMVTVLIGANDACAADTGTMTSVARFRASFDSTLSYLHRTLPTTQVLVASIPDLRRLWSVGRTNPLGRQVWKLGLCPTMLDDPTSDSPAATQRRSAVRARVQAYNTVLGQVCATYQRCRYDDGAVFAYPFGTGDLSDWDWFHPNEQGQSQLARIMAAVATRPATATG
ncbi:Lysophospholipase L1 [Actinacidiphila yanglinensis]|uniref:Lysophospholipase L1 n=1 Tax=Actinacidiphila yanglinensis TaxID=310779 RepID=A0A1H5SDQ0_9ACTN|nr:SGNH/GDSL hydrolase family protein [Actinacidiphila yanglinensis]SEF48540.1 Lysophospholipase L1 [Actinacidiphila yanglinensis]